MGQEVQALQPDRNTVEGSGLSENLKLAGSITWGALIIRIGPTILYIIIIQ